MATFIMAMNIIPSAKKEQPDLGKAINASLEVFSENKVKVSKLFATLGRYDYLAMFYATDQTIAFKVASQINAKGVLDTETWPVVPYEEFSHYF